MKEQQKYQVSKHKDYFTLVSPQGKAILYQYPSGVTTVEEIANLTVEELNLIDAKSESESIIYRAYSFFGAFSYHLNFYYDLCEFSTDLFRREDYRLLLKLSASDILIIRTLFQEFEEKIKLNSITDWVLGHIDSGQLIKDKELDKVWKKRLDIIRPFLPFFRKESRKMSARELDFKFISYTVKHPAYTQTVEKENSVKEVDPNNVLAILEDSFDYIKVPASEFDFNDEDFLQAREHAVALALKIKKDKKSYNGIELILNYQRMNSKGIWVDKKYKILTGKRMGTDKILPSMREEVALLINMGMVFPIGYTHFNEEYYGQVNIYPTSMYYFTA